MTLFDNTESFSDNQDGCGTYSLKLHRIRFLSLMQRVNKDTMIHMIIDFCLNHDIKIIQMDVKFYPFSRYCFIEVNCAACNYNLLRNFLDEYL